MTTLQLLVTIILIPIGLYVWWRQECQTSRLNQPVLPNSKWLKPFIYLWWLFTGFWKEKRLSVTKSEMPWRFRFVRFLFWWLFTLALILELMLIVELWNRINLAAI